MQPLDRVGRSRAPPLARRQAGKGEETVARLLQAVGDGAMLEPPFAQESLAARGDLLRRRRVDHVVVVRRDLLVQPLRRMGQQVAVLVHGAALNRHAAPHRIHRLLQPRRTVEDQERGAPQAALEEVVEDRPPRLGALAAHALGGEQHFLAVRPHPDDDQQRDRGGLAVEPHAHHRAVEDEAHDRLVSERTSVPGGPVALYLAPHPAHHVLAHAAGKQRSQRAADPARVGARQVAAGDQGVGRQCASLVDPQGPAPPLAGRAVRLQKPRPRHRDLRLAEGAGQRPPAAPVAVAHDGPAIFFP